MTNSTPENGFAPSVGSNQKGFSIVELLIASFIGIIAVVGVLYMYKNQHKSMLIQSGKSEMRMNGQYTLKEAQYDLAHAGLGLPSNFKNLLVVGPDLVIRMNTTRKSCQGTMDASSTTTYTIYQIKRADTLYFLGRAFVAATVFGNVVEAPIVSVANDPGDPAGALLTLLGDKNDFSATATLFPLEKIQLHLCTGVGADTVKGDFRVLQMDPKLRSGLKLDSLTLSEGIDSLGYRYYLFDKSIVTALPANLDLVEKIGVVVIARSLVKDPVSKGDGYARDTLMAAMKYRNSF